MDQNEVWKEEMHQLQELLPVILSIMPPSEVQPSLFPLLKYRYMDTGEKAFKTLVSYFQILNMPIPPIMRNQRSTIGAKSQPTLSIPWC